MRVVCRRRAAVVCSGKRAWRVSRSFHHVPRQCDYGRWSGTGNGLYLLCPTRVPVTIKVRQQDITVPIWPYINLSLVLIRPSIICHIRLYLLCPTRVPRHDQDVTLLGRHPQHPGRQVLPLLLLFLLLLLPLSLRRLLPPPPLPLTPGLQRRRQPRRRVHGQHPGLRQHLRRPGQEPKGGVLPFRTAICCTYGGAPYNREWNDEE